MVVLVIDSVTPVLYVALIKGEHVIERTCDVQKAHDKNLNRSVKEVLSESGIAFPDIDAFAVVTGPGSWTGCRVGVVAVKAYALAANASASLNIIDLRACDRENIVSNVIDKFKKKEFITAAELMPFYDGEFKVTLRNTMPN